MNAHGTFIHTNILLYAHAADDSEPRAKIARTVLRDLWETGDGILSTQVLQEFYAVATRKVKPRLPVPPPGRSWQSTANGAP